MTIVSSFEIKNRAPQVRRDPLGKCVYCGSVDYRPGEVRVLGEEHIIPESLGGNLALPAASCASCERSINQFEQLTLKTVLYAPRVRLGVRRKKRKRHAEFYTLRGSVGGKDVQIELPLSEVPVLLMLPRFGPPGIIANRPLEHADMRGVWLQKLAGNWTGHRKHGLDAGMSPVLDTVAFCRFLAKIAHGFATDSLDGQFQPRLLNLILLGQPEGRYHYVGGEPAVQPESDNLHELALVWHLVNGRRFAVVRIRLFASLGAPTYYVVAGEEITRRTE